MICNVRSFGLALVLVLVPATVMAGPARRARAVTAKEAAAVVDRNFAAVAKGDVRGARALWSKRPAIELFDAGGNASHPALADALARWSEHRDGLTWSVDGVDPDGDGFLVHATVHWNGGTYQDTLHVARVGGALRITAKRSVPGVASASQGSYG